MKLQESLVRLLRGRRQKLLSYGRLDVDPEFEASRAQAVRNGHDCHRVEQLTWQLHDESSLRHHAKAN